MISILSTMFYTQFYIPFYILYIQRVSQRAKRPASSRATLHQQGWGWLFSLLLISTLAACQSTGEVSDPAAETASPAAQNNTDANGETQGKEVAVDPIAPLALADALPPKLLSIPVLDLEVAVRPMGWAVVEREGERTTQWKIPEGAAGWHVNSAGVGGDGNTILSGQQASGEAVFAPLALGEIVLGQQVLLTAQDDTVYVYEVSEVSTPIPVIGATDQDLADAQAYLQTDGKARLTLITGWPDFSTTHRIFAVAEFLGKAQDQ